MNGRSPVGSTSTMTPFAMACVISRSKPEIMVKSERRALHHDRVDGVQDPRRRHDAARCHLVQHPGGGDSAFGDIEHEHAADIVLAGELVIGAREYAAQAVEIIARGEAIFRDQRVAARTGTEAASRRKWGTPPIIAASCWRRKTMALMCRLIACSLLALSLQSAPAAAQYPNKPITVIVPFAAGGPTDVVTRLVGDHMSRTLGQTLVVENIGGAGGTLGMIRAAQAQPDGYTIAVGNMGTQSAAPALYPNLKYDPAKSFAQVGIVNYTPQAIVAKKDTAAKTLKEFIDYLKANNTKLTYGHAGVGSISHVS